MSGDGFRSYMAEKLATMGFQSLMADPYVWLRAATKVDGESYHEYVLMYVNDILSISCDPRTILEKMQDTFKFKSGHAHGHTVPVSDRKCPCLVWSNDVLI